MVANLTKPRPDIVYLRRRLKVGEKLPTSPVAVQNSSLSLSAPQEAVTASLPVIPTVTGDIVLDAAQPVVRLNRRQSAIGSLILSGISYVAWELVDGTTGFLYSSAEAFKSAEVVNFESGKVRPALPEIIPQSFKNRPLIEFHRGVLVIGLRNLKAIRRVIFVPKMGQDIQAVTLGTASVLLPYNENTALYLSVVNSCIELRSEKFRGNVHETFRIGTYSPPSTSINIEGAKNLRDLFSENRG